jgi:hypothetical protein
MTIRAIHVGGTVRNRWPKSLAPQPPKINDVPIGLGNQVRGPESVWRSNQPRRRAGAEARRWCIDEGRVTLESNLAFCGIGDRHRKRGRFARPTLAQIPTGRAFHCCASALGRGCRNRAIEWALLRHVPVRLLASRRRDREAVETPVARPERRRSVRSHARRASAYSGAVARISSSGSRHACSAVPRLFCSGAPAHASGGSVRDGDGRQATLPLFRAQPLPKRATRSTLADAFAPVAAERRRANACRDHRRQR